MDQMDVADTRSAAKRPANSPPSTPSSGKRTKSSLLPEVELRKVNNSMGESYKYNLDRARLLGMVEGVLEMIFKELHFELRFTSISKDLVSLDDIRKVVESNLQKLESIAKDCVETRDWKTAIPYIHKPSLKSSTASIERSATVPDSEAQEATLASWKENYLGRSADLVEGVLKDYMTAEDYYARYTPHIQSSGTGKSRVHDELAKRMLYIPMCLASEGATAYPPSDPKVREWFAIVSQISDQETAHNRCCSFLHALMIQAKDALDEIVKELEEKPTNVLPAGGSEDDVEKRVHLLASTFRRKMSEGGTYSEHGPYRVNFYRNVVRIAEENSKKVFASSAPRKPGKAQDCTEQDATESNPIESAANKVLLILDPRKRCQMKPLMIICWDESHSLADAVGNKSWSPFSELRHALGKIRRLPIFSVFLSTAPKFHSFSPDMQYRPSHRVANLALSPFPPITEVGFDEFVEKVKPNGETTLTEVASIHHMAHLGRALFATRYDCGNKYVKNTILTFAQTKLLCRQISGRPLKPAEALACLAVRLGLEFMSASWWESEAEREQVERHMRLCLAATSGFRNMVTISPSEPLLAEAAFKTMVDTSTDNPADNMKVNFPAALLTHMETSHLDPGNRGEVVAALLILLARDKAVKNRKSTATNTGLNSDGATRIITVPEFLEALLPAACHELVGDLQPSHFHGQEHAKKSLKEAFADGRIWFNHFIKVKDSGMVNRQYLWSLISRGAAVICANNHHGVDLVVPILFGDHLKPDAVSAILIQVKNDSTFTHKARTVLFDLMNPFEVDLFSMDEAPSLPVIRLVFALAAKQSAIVFRAIPKCESGPSESGQSKPKIKSNQYTAYDIWVAGVTHESFGVISATENATYKLLLRHSCKVFNGYNLFDKHYNASAAQQKDRASARRRMHPGATPLIEHQENYISSEKPVDAASVEPL